jgi:hypothetical protein
VKSFFNHYKLAKFGQHKIPEMPKLFQHQDFFQSSQNFLGRNENFFNHYNIIGQFINSKNCPKVLERPGKKILTNFGASRNFFLRRNEIFPVIKIPTLSKFFRATCKIISQEFSRVPKFLGNMEIVFVKTGGDRELSDRSCGRSSVLEFENLQL